MDGGDVSVEGKVTCASCIKRPENAHLAVIGKSTGTCSSLEIFSVNSETTSLSSSPKATYVLEEGGEPVRIAVHPSGDDFVCSTTTGCKHYPFKKMDLGFRGRSETSVKVTERCLSYMVMKIITKFVCKEFPLQDVGPQKCMAFSVDGSKLATGGVDGHFRLFEWPTMRIIVDEPKAHKSFRDMDFSLDSEFLASTSTDGAARIRNTTDGVPVTLSQNTDQNIELCRFSKDGTKPFLFTTVQKGILKGSKDGDICVIDVTKMEISSLHKRLLLGTNITSLEFCPSERVALTTSSQWGVMVTKLNVPTDWKGPSLFFSV
ncbi:hypothetical protein MTR67_046887 [Solanum verrucosum]|uniref:Uncharacterized protein n=1 Tax=Solanum verrucosum TaxID=315347 RepID=A0AAF0UW27_SOLVR|nr:hypothetical protein MTR67_046887 [Solanum verrucosum]